MKKKEEHVCEWGGDNCTRCIILSIVVDPNPCIFIFRTQNCNYCEIKSDCKTIESENNMV